MIYWRDRFLVFVFKHLVFIIIIAIGVLFVVCVPTWGFMVLEDLDRVFRLVAFHHSFGCFWEKVVFTANSAYKVWLFGSFWAEHVLGDLLLGSCTPGLAFGEWCHGWEARVGWIDRVSLVVMHAVVAAYVRDGRSLLRKVGQVALVLAELALVDSAWHCDRSPLLAATEVQVGFLLQANGVHGLE